MSKPTKRDQMRNALRTLHLERERAWKFFSEASPKPPGKREKGKQAAWSDYLRKVAEKAQACDDLSYAIELITGEVDYMRPFMWIP